MADRGYSRPDPIRATFADMLTNRDSGTKSARFLNVVYDLYSNKITEEKRLFLKKRAGYQAVNQPPATTAVGRGVYYWARNDTIYSVFGDKLYQGTTAIQTLNTSTGPVSFSETQGGTPYLVLHDGTDGWYVTTGHTVTEITDVDFPTPLAQGLEVVDGYMVVIKSSTGEIYNSDVDDPTSWTATNFLSPEMYPDGAVALSRYRNLLIAFGTRSTEFFYDAATATGSPFARVEQMAQQIGCAAASTVARLEDSVFFVGQTQYGRNVYTIEKDRFITVGDASLGQILDNEADDISNADAMIVHMHGMDFYVISLNTSGRTFAFNISNGTWTEWSSDPGSLGNFAKFALLYSTDDAAGQTIVQHRTNGYVYRMSDTLYQDAGDAIQCQITTSLIDAGTNKRKFYATMELIGDKYTNANNVSVSWSDDDYQTFSTARSLDLNNGHTFLRNLGASRRRAFRFYTADNDPLRLEAIELEFDLGDY